MRVVVIGSGAREHALAWGLAHDADVVVTPGSDGIAAHGIACTSTSPVDLSADLFVVGPEMPLVSGLADTLRAQGKAVFGPGADGAMLEGSKAYMKELLAVANVPTAAYGSFDVLDDALAMLRAMPAPYVIKTDGLAAGKGVLVTSSLADAELDVRDKMSGRSFGSAGARVVIEEALVGEECSLLVLVDGERAIAMIPAQDFKRVGNSDSGPNTGGMGALAPLPSMTNEVIDDVMRSIIEPTLRELRRRGIEYRGVLYAGLMLTSSGPKLLEFNVRFGDPETEVVVPMVRDGLADTLLATAKGRLCTSPNFRIGAAVTVVLASRGYPLSDSRGDLIDGLGADGQLLDPVDDVVIFHAGTRQRDDQRFETAGGRVLAVTARGSDIATARESAYRAVSRVSFAGMVMRSDISARYAEGAG